MFDLLATQVKKNLKEIQNYPMFRSTATKDGLWDTYISSFPEGTNPVFRERSEHDCQCCKQFIRAVGNLVAIKDGKLISIWDNINTGTFYDVVAKAMADANTGASIESVFYHDTAKVGTVKSLQETDLGTLEFSHFHGELLTVTKGSDIPTKQAETLANKEVLERSLSDISDTAVDTVVDLIESDAIYRGQEHLPVIKKLQDVKASYNAYQDDKQIWLWSTSTVLGFAGRYRNTVIGTLLTDISEGVELETAVKSFESKVAPQNYKRPKALVTTAMINKAQDQVEALGLEPSLHRRYAVLDDISINNVLYADRSVKKALGVFDSLKQDIAVDRTQFKHSKELSIEDFMNSIGDTSSVEVLVENSHESNLVSLVAPVHADAKPLFKWDNGFSWSYTGELADSSLRNKVQELGGRVDGAFRFSHTWNYNGDNQSLMDLHVFMPSNSTDSHKDGKHDHYPEGRRVGWNRRSDRMSSGVQDVDFVNPPNKDIPVENITFPSIVSMPEGTYILKIHNWKLRAGTTGGFKAEIEFNGQVFEYEYTKPLGHKEWITVAEVTLRNGEFTINHKLPTTTSTREFWGLSTNKFHRVNSIMNSPNHWDTEVGNKHWFFMLDKCVKEGSTRGFYNEFLRSDLETHRKIFEMLGNKLKTEPSSSQLSGLGFSKQKNSVVCRITKNNKTEVVKVNFL